MDPYIVLDYRGLQEKTPVSEEGGTNPVWNKSFVFNVFTLEEIIHLNCFSKSFILDDFIGLAQLQVSQFSKAYEESTFKIPIKRKQKDSGLIVIKAKYQPKILAARMKKSSSKVLIPELIFNKAASSTSPQKKMTQNDLKALTNN